jgi:RNA polymerase sigma factor (TIGR02999 family)
VSPDQPDKPPASEVTALLHAWSAGDRAVEPRLFELVLPDLHKLAHFLLRSERSDHSLQSTALINEAYLRLVGARQRDWENRRHFLAVAARAMRHLLIDHARGRAKGVKTPLDGMEDMLRGRDDQLELGIAIGGLLEELDKSHPDWCSIVEMKFFAGFTDEETADALGTPLRTMQRKFGDARRWLYERLEPHHAPGPLPWVVQP